MTRRLFARRPLDLRGYIHRATVGLPSAERLDAAAELRTHLVGQIDRLRAAGHPADEAEYLAVQAMGDPAPTNRGFLGHAFTHRAGWAVLAAVLLGGGGWAGYGYAQREWTPPREGIQFSGDLTLDDLKALNTDEHAPKGRFQAATLTYPRGTKTIYYALVTPGHLEVQSKDLQAELRDNQSANAMHRLPGSYRYQERWLMTDMGHKTVCPGRWELYSNSRVIQNALLPLQSQTWPMLDDLTACTGVKRQYRTLTTLVLKPGSYAEGATVPRVPFSYDVELFPASMGGVATSAVPTGLPLDHWTVLRQLVLNPRTALNGLPALRGTAAGMYIAVLPSSQPGVAGAYGANGTVDAHGNVSLLGVGRTPLPPAPQLDAAQTQFVAR
ncbi:permease prefix domain 1-containing protein [Deinococcus radiomollis]|uniref:permease prefix domain 1-containing protein n=1 Tax=Deinococcus radiomollis TaxID=468916 RepID=UPI0038924267